MKSKTRFGMTLAYYLLFLRYTIRNWGTRMAGISKNQTRRDHAPKEGGIAFISGFLEGKFFLARGIPVSKTLLWANNDFARGFRAGYYGDELAAVRKREEVIYGDSARRDRRRFKRVANPRLR
jgi:hypothetical protein